MCIICSANLVIFCKSANKLVKYKLQFVPNCSQRFFWFTNRKKGFAFFLVIFLWMIEIIWNCIKFDYKNFIHILWSIFKCFFFKIILMLLNLNCTHLGKKFIIICNLELCIWDLHYAVFILFKESFFFISHHSKHTINNLNTWLVINLIE